MTLVHRLVFGNGVDILDIYSFSTLGVFPKVLQNYEGKPENAAILQNLQLFLGHIGLLQIIIMYKHVAYIIVLH